MRIERIDLGRFGHFVDTALELDHPAGGLRFVVGPNEAGKSTLRAALRTGLFGFDGRLAAGQPAASSALALRLERGDGEVLDLVRHGMGAPRDGAGRPIEAATLHGWITVTREAFDRLCCLGHDELRRYGHDLLQSGADLGRIAFGAALGGTHVQRVSADLDTDLDRLYRPGAKTRELNRVLDELKGADDALRTATVTADTWLALLADLERVAERLAALDREEAARAEERARLERVKRTANARAALRQHREELERVRAEGPTPDRDAGARLERLVHDRTATTADIARREGELQALEARRAEIPVDRSALDRTAAITALHQEIAGYREAVERVRRHELEAASRTPLADADRLEAAVVDAAGVRGLVDVVRDEQAAIAKSRAALSARKRELGLDAVADEALATLPVPSEAAIEAARDAVADRAAQRTQLQKDGRQVADDLDRTARELAELEAGGAPLPSDAEIAKTRGQRDRSWGALKAWFVDEAPPPTGPTDRAGLAATVEGGIARADDLADRVRADTARAARLQSVRRQLEDHHQRRDRLDEARQRLVADDHAADEAWGALWRGVTERVGTPAEMSAWRTEWRSACSEAAALAAAEAAAAARHHAIADAEGRLRSALAATGHAAPEDAGALALLAQAEALLEAERQRRADEAEAAKAQARVAHVDARLADLRDLVPAADRSPGDRTIQALHDLREQQATWERDRKALDRAIADGAEALRTARTELERLDEAVAAEAAALGVEVAQLEAVVARAQAAADLRSKVASREEQLLDAGDGLDVAALHAEAEAVGSVDVLEGRLQAIEREREALKQDRTEATKRQVELQGQLGALTGHDDAATVHEGQARTLSRLADLLDEIAVLVLERSILERVIEDARATGQGPLIERAGHYFALLTDAAFGGLDLEVHGERAYPVAVRSDGSRLYPTALSDGTVDQLWLAWRLAGVEHHLEHVGPVPLIVDDVLVNFDDQRAASAFAALAALAERTQVLVLTHHPHLVDVARARLGPERVTVTHLSGRPAGAMPITQVVSADEAIGRPPLPMPEAPARSGARAPAAPANASDDVLVALRNAVDGTLRGKSELLERSGIDDRAWTASIRQLLAEGWVEQEGAKRGARYRRPK